MNKLKRVKELVEELNHHRDLYYNKTPEISDYEYDNLYDELLQLESETGVVFANSPTHTVGFEVKSKLETVKHSHKMLSLKKTKSINELIEFAGNQDCILMHKCDGLTVLLTYENGELVQAETRGNGEEGEIITHNARVFKNIPKTIPYTKHFEIEGEAIIYRTDFEKINSTIENIDDKYKNPRNLVSGSVRQLDSYIAANRCINFVAWKVPNDDMPNSMVERFTIAKEYGFTVVPFISYTSKSEYDKANIENMIKALKIKSEEIGLPIDGLVMAYNDIEYGKSLGNTTHHPRHSIAFKFYEEEETTTLRNIEWSVGKFGEITPVLLFDEVELNDTTVKRASAHNLSILSNFKIGIGDEIVIYKANEIIPQCRDNLTKSNTWEESVPKVCPVCGGDTVIEKDNGSTTLHCSNPDCSAKSFGKLCHFVSKHGVDIEGLSEANLEILISCGYVNEFIDLYHLKNSSFLLDDVPGFKTKSKQNLLDSIELSRNIELNKFIAALSIPGVGYSTSKDIANKIIHDAEAIDWGGIKRGDLKSWFMETIMFTNINYWSSINGIGDKTSSSINEYFSNNFKMINRLVEEFNFIYNDPYKNTESDNCHVNLNNKTFCITGSLNHLNNRDEFIELVNSNGGKYLSSVNAKLNYLVINDINSTSSKAKKAKELNVTLITEEEFLQMIEKV